MHQLVSLCFADVYLPQKLGVAQSVVGEIILYDIPMLVVQLLVSQTSGSGYEVDRGGGGGFVITHL